jgi:hypothetical protein
VTLGAATDTTSRLRFVFEHLTAESGDTPYAPAEGPGVSRRAIRRAKVMSMDGPAAVGEAAPDFAGYFEAVADALSGKCRARGDPGGRARSIELVTAIYDAARSRKEVALPLTPDADLYRSWLPTRARGRRDPGQGTTS